MQADWETELLAGDMEATEQAARQGCEQLERLGDHGRLSLQACQLADALYALGRYDEAWQSAQRGLELAHQEDLSTQLAGLTVRSKLLAREGDHPAAITLAQEIEELAKTSDSPVDHRDAALNVAESCT